MSGSQEQPWSDNPNAPKISYHVYSEEKSSFAGTLIASMFYGIMIIVFFQCMAALFSPVHRGGERIKWGLVSYTAVMFSLATIFTAMNLNIQSNSYIDNREFPGAEGVVPPGPFGYQWFISTEVLSIVPNIIFTLNNWLADGLLLYRCYVIYSMNLWVIAFPCFMYLGSVAMGIVVVYQTTQLISSDWATIPYFSISLSLNVLLTLMIVVRLTLHARSIRTAMGGSRSGGLYKAIVTMFIESCAINAVTSLLVLALIGAGNDAVSIFVPIFPETQVIAPLFIIHRVATKSALTSNTLVSGCVDKLSVGCRGELTGGSSTVLGGDHVSPADHERGILMNTGELGVGVEITNDSHGEEVY